MASETPESTNTMSVETGGGTFINGNVNTNGDFVAGDINNNTKIYIIQQPPPPTRNVEDDIKRNIQLRKRLRSELITLSDHWHEIGYRPDLKYEFTSVIIHSTTDEAYGRDTESSSGEQGYSGWFRVDMWDLYYDGLEVIVDVEYALVDEDGRWMLIERNQIYSTDEYCKIKLFRLGCIPLRNIVEFEADGDEYYPHPHFYCRFDDNGGPFAEYRWVMIDDEDCGIDTLLPYRMNIAKKVELF